VPGTPHELRVKGDDVPVVRVSAIKALQGDAEGVAGVIKLMEALEHPTSRSRSARSTALHDADRAISGARHRGDGARGARPG